MDDSVRRPLGLRDRLVRAAGEQDRCVERAVGPEGGDPEPARVPGHVGMVPFEPGEAAAVRRPSRRGQEVGTPDEDRRRLLAVERHGHDRRLRLPLDPVVLADRQVATSRRIRPNVGVAPRPLRRDRDRLRVPGIDPVEAPVGEVREDDHATGGHVRAAAVLVDPGPDVERRRGHVDDRAVDPRAHEDAPPGLRRARLDPVGVVAIDRRLAEDDRIADDVVDPDRGGPAAVGGDRRLGRCGLLDHVPWRHEATYSTCSGVIASSVIPRAASLSRATSASIASGTT